MIDHILLDMDGVLADFASAAVKLHGHEPGLEHWQPGEGDFAKVLGISRDEFWRKIDEAGSAFWASLEPYPWFHELIELVSSVAPFSVLTSPSLSPSCLKGKAAWLYEQFPEVEGRAFRNFMIGRPKQLLAQPNRLLIDDSPRNVEEFERAGGQAILFPQVWNRDHHIDDPIPHLREQIAQRHETD